MSGKLRKIETSLIELAEKDERYIPFTNKLQLLVKGFEIDQIQHFVEQYLEQTP